MKIIKIDLQDGKFIDVAVASDEEHGQLTDLLNWYETARKELVEAVDDARKSGEVDKDRLDMLEAKYG